eukprot:jgi/Astpho2/302/Aster-x0915
MDRFLLKGHAAVAATGQRQSSRPSKRQRTLADCKKVAILVGHTTHCFSDENVNQLKEVLNDTSKAEQHLATLFALSAMDVQRQHLEQTQVAHSVRDLAKNSSCPDVQRVAGNLIQKWKDVCLKQPMNQKQKSLFAG